MHTLYPAATGDRNVLLQEIVTVKKAGIFHSGAELLMMDRCSLGPAKPNADNMVGRELYRIIQKMSLTSFASHLFHLPSQCNN